MDRGERRYRTQRYKIKQRKLAKQAPGLFYDEEEVVVRAKNSVFDCGRPGCLVCSIKSRNQLPARDLRQIEDQE